MNISFVILHYMAVNDTIECIESIKNNIITSAEVSIVVVDNASPDNSFQVLSEKYVNTDNVFLIHSEENCGFAKGNNLGFMFAKEKFNPDFIVMINNDTVIEQREFCDLIIDGFANTGFDIAGPNIISLKGSINQNPIPYSKISVSDVDRRIRKYKILDWACGKNADKIIHKIYGIVKGKKRQTEPLNDFKLHGSCLLFSRQYIQKYDGLYPKTFMYGEEDILKWIALRDNLIMSYLENVSIKHKEDASTDIVFKNGKKKRHFYYKWNINSLEILRDLMTKEL